ncbi:DUF6444 domain-containing protein [Streptomyces sp. NPDC057909]|uniref:DUF6444 domain-containing protein n=1 Tax=Streptomyces sp. NPDC057909 TaxID=3346277 RepID=UPI0036E43DB4
MSQTVVLPSYEELAALVVELRGELAAASERIAVLEAEVTDLRARLGQNSANSSKPSSSDGLAKPTPKSLRGKSGRGPGRPKGPAGYHVAPDRDPG